MMICRRDELLGLLGRGRDRLLDENVLPSFEECERDLVMSGGRKRVHDRIRVRIEQVAPVRHHRNG